jgi:hypothetical protein
VPLLECVPNGVWVQKGESQQACKATYRYLSNFTFVLLKYSILKALLKKKGYVCIHMNTSFSRGLSKETFMFCMVAAHRVLLGLQSGYLCKL